jgi:hypothetical protein
VELSESSTPTSSSRLTGFEVATRLSYLIWNSAPDDDLLAAARER